ncbi:MAG: MFS transporter [Dehalococcoidia bacterium]
MAQATLDPATQRRYEQNILRFYFYQFASNFALWAPIWVLYLRDMRGLSLTEITALDAPFWVMMIVAEVPTGTVADRWGRKTSLLWGALVYAAAIFVFGLADSFPLLLVSYLTWAVALTLQSGADNAFVYDSLLMVGREAEFRKVIGRAQALTSAGFLLGGLLGAPLAARTDLAFPILVSAATMLLAVAVATTFREPRHLEGGPRLPYMTTMRTAAGHIHQRPGLRWMIAVRAALLGGSMISVIFTQPFLAEFDVPVAQFGLYASALALLRIGGALTAYRLVGWLGERNLLYAIGAAGTVALLVLGTVPAMAAFAMFGVISICTSVTMTITADYISRRTPQSLRATVLSVAQMGSSAVLLLGEPALGFVADRSSLQVAFFGSGVGLGVLAIATLAGWTAAERAERARGPWREPAGVGAESG